jgi:hypothetical protein
VPEQVNAMLERFIAYREVLAAFERDRGPERGPRGRTVGS